MLLGASQSSRKKLWYNWKKWYHYASNDSQFIKVSTAQFCIELQSQIQYNCFKPGPHLYANANEACGTEANSNECSVHAKSGLFGIRLIKHTPSIVNIFFFEVPTPKRKCSAVHQRSPYKRMLFAAPWLQVHINISLISARLIHIRVQMWTRLHMHTFAVLSSESRTTSHCANAAQFGAVRLLSCSSLFLA